MKTLEAYVRHLAECDHPGAELGRLVLAHSNDPTYLRNLLDAFVRAVEFDVKAEQDFRSQVMGQVRKDQQTREGTDNA